MAKNCLSSSLLIIILLKKLNAKNKIFFLKSKYKYDLVSHRLKPTNSNVNISDINQLFWYDTLYYTMDICNSFLVAVFSLLISI